MRFARASFTLAIDIGDCVGRKDFIEDETEQNIFDAIPAHQSAIRTNLRAAVRVRGATVVVDWLPVI